MFLYYSNWKISIILFIIILWYIISKFKKDLTFEEWILTLTTLIGSIVIITCDHLFILYLGLELQTFPIFILIAKNKYWLKSSEASLKYFMLGALSSGIFLLGLTIIFLNGCSLNIEDFLFHYFYKKKILQLSFFLIILSLFFKINMFPLHFWIPDIYEGSSWEVIGLLGTIPKISIVYLLIQFKELGDIFIICSIMSIIIGSLGALNQTKLKRLLAYSGISHIGFIILILSVHNQKNLVINNIYLFIYIINLLAIIILISYLSLSNHSFILELCNNQFINKIIGFSWIILILSMAGIPPLSGFISKWLVLLTLVEENFMFSSIICILFSAVSASFYLRLIVIIYFQKSSPFFVWKYILNMNRYLHQNIYFLGLFTFFTLFLICKPFPLLLFFNSNFNLIT